MKKAGQLTGSTRLHGRRLRRAGGVTTGPGGPVNAYEDRREYSTPSFSALGQGYLRLTQNPATGQQLGDAQRRLGRPELLRRGCASETNVIAGTTITGDPFWQVDERYQRVDTDASRAFLGRYVKLP